MRFSSLDVQTRLWSFGLKRAQALCRDYVFPAPSGTQAVHVFLKNVLKALHSSREGAGSLFEHKKKCETNKAEIEPSMKAPVIKLSESSSLPKTKWTDWSVRTTAPRRH